MHSFCIGNSGGIACGVAALLYIQFRLISPRYLEIYSLDGRTTKDTCDETRQQSDSIKFPDFPFNLRNPKNIF